jgi:RHS repeat-associated protein
VSHISLTDRAASYTAFGILTSSGQMSAFGFAGEYTDSESGLIYLRNRYYDPSTGQFLSVDPIVDLTGAPFSYADDDPINWDDPSGLHAWLKDLEHAGHIAKYVGIAAGVVTIAAGACVLTLCTADAAAAAVGVAGVATWVGIGADVVSTTSGCITASATQCYESAVATGIDIGTFGAGAGQFVDIFAGSATLAIGIASQNDVGPPGYGNETQGPSSGPPCDALTSQPSNLQSPTSNASLQTPGNVELQ